MLQATNDMVFFVHTAGEQYIRGFYNSSPTCIHCLSAFVLHFLDNGHIGGTGTRKRERKVTEIG